MSNFPVSRSVLAFLSVVALSSVPGLARADIEHVVSKGHTLQAIANRYHVTVRSIMEKNNLRDAKRLQLGQVLVIPGVGGNGAKKKGEAGGKAELAGASASNAKQGDTKAQQKPGASKYAARAKDPGVIRGHRLATNEEFVLRVGRGRRIPAGTLSKAKNMFRSSQNQTHSVDGRLLALLGVVSDHFGSRPIEVISGFRPYKSSQYTKDSRHNHGKAVDFRVVGVPNTAVRDFCRTLHNTGCGYYPNSVFVHMDVRDKSEYWVDYSRPGEKPKYDKPSPEADEGTSDVHETGTSGSAKKPSEEHGESSSGPTESDSSGSANLPSGSQE